MQYTSHNLDQNSRHTDDALSIGEIFKQQRNNKEWTKRLVAKSLNLTIAQITALEENDYTMLGGATYVKGYIRSYAKLLELDITKSAIEQAIHVDEMPCHISIDAEYHQAHLQQEKIKRKSVAGGLLAASLFLGGVWFLDSENFSYQQSSNQQPTTKVIVPNPTFENSGLLTPKKRKTNHYNEQYNKVVLPEPNFIEKDIGSS